MDKYIELIYKYYPKNLFPSDLAYSYTPEVTRKFKLHDELISSSSNNFSKVCKDLNLLTDCCILDYSFIGHDLSWHTDFYAPDEYQCPSPNTCGLYISAVCDYYCVYFSNRDHDIIPYLKANSPTEGQRKLSDPVQKIIKLHFPNHRPIPLGWLDKEVPGVISSCHSREYDDLATYFECLITSKS